MPTITMLTTGTKPKSVRVTPAQLGNPINVVCPPNVRSIRLSRNIIIEGIKPDTRWVPCQVCKKPTITHICPTCDSKGHLVCAACNAVFQNDDPIYEGEDGQGLCKKCRTNYFVCPLCGGYKQVSGRTSEGLCTACTSRYPRNRAQSIYLGYGCSPQFRYYTAKGKTKSFDHNTLYLGVELETEYSADENRFAALLNLHKLSEGKKLFYMTTDSTLSNGGIEVITHPCTLEFHQTKFPYKEIHDVVRAQSGRSHHAKSAGIHVHMSAAYFGGLGTIEYSLNVAKITYLVERFWKNWVKFSRRSPYNMREWAAHLTNTYITRVDNPMKMNTARVLSDNGGQGRHTALNFGNDASIEFRIFRGSLKPDTILAILETVDYMGKWAKPRSLQTVHKAAWRDIFANASTKRYPHMLAYMTKRGCE